MNYYVIETWGGTFAELSRHRTWAGACKAANRCLRGGRSPVAAVTQAERDRAERVAWNAPAAGAWL